MNRQPAFRVKQHSTRFTLKRQKMLTPISNFENFCSASPSFRLSVCKHKAFFSICVQKTLNTRLETIEHNRSARRPMPLQKRTPQGQARRLQRWVPFSAASHNNTPSIHPLFQFQKALWTRQRRYVAQQPAVTRNRSVGSRMPSWNPYTNSP